MCIYPASSCLMTDHVMLQIEVENFYGGKDQEPPLEKRLQNIVLAAKEDPGRFVQGLRMLRTGSEGEAGSMLWGEGSMSLLGTVWDRLRVH
jgi:hypothetical protein